MRPAFTAAVVGAGSRLHQGHRSFSPPTQDHPTGRELISQPPQGCPARSVAYTSILQPPDILGVTVDGRPRWRRPTGRPTGSSAGRPLRQIGPGGRDPVRRDLVGPEVRAVATAHRLGKVAPLTTVVAPSRLVRCPDRIRLRLGQPLLQRLPPGRFRPPRTGNHRRIVRNGSPNSPIRIERTAPPKTGPSMTTCGVPAVRSFLRLDPTPAVRMTVRPFRRPGGVRAGRTYPDQVRMGIRVPMAG
jgi:hypothetical protein